MADYTFIDLFPDIANREYEEGVKGWNDIFGNPLIDPLGSVSITHVVFTGVLVIGLTILALIARRKYASPETALVPEGKLTVAGFFEAVFDGVYGLMVDLMGDKATKKYFPLIGSLAVFIFFGNIMGLVVGLYPPTSNLNTGLACALVVFLVYNIGGLIENGPIGYLKHFMGPVLWLAPIMLVIEVLSHAFRPISLAARLGGNMSGDHMVLEVFGDVGIQLIGIPLILPIPFLFMGLLISTLQALVFCLLSTIYIALAISHDH